MSAAVSGCAQAAPSTLPEGVLVEVQQGRTDYTSGTLVIRVINGSGSDFELESARLTWPGFARPALWERGTTLRQGATVDLRAPVPEVACGDGIQAAGPTADLTFRDGDSRTTATAPVSDPLSTLDRLRKAGCVTEEVDRVAAVSVGPPVIEGEGRSAVAVVPLTLTPTGAEGRVEVSGVSSTPLLVPDPAAHPHRDGWLFDAGVDAASGPVTTELRIVPARCDAHAIADDKVGTVLNLDVVVPGGLSGTYQLVAPDDVRGALLNYVRGTCGLL